MRPEQLQRAFGGFQVARFPQQVPQALQGEGGDAIAGRRGVVVAALGAMDQGLVVVGCEVEPPGLLVLEAGQQAVGQCDGEVEVVDAGTLRWTRETAQYGLL